jgi:beta-glucosidase-like glycosyl hydrolase/CubicO group peptidase (beta-lactamase class C family)
LRALIPKLFSYRIIALIISVLIFSSYEKNINSQSSISANDEIYPSVFPLSEHDKVWIEKQISVMSLREKCAQMIMAPVYRSYMDTLSPDYNSTVALVKDYKIGGLIMFQGELEQQINFIREMQLLSDIPVLISADYERGLGSRIDDALEFPHSMALGATLDSQLGYELASAIANESWLVGVHQIFAPVADINNNPLNPVINTRSFSESKFTVSEFVSSFILGTKHRRMIATVKHFPGHGNTEIDSHTDLPMISGDKQKLFENELYPFIQAVNNGVQSVMVGHLEVPAYDTLPATLSKNIITNLLYNTLEFDGLVVTDAMNMNAINNYNSFSPEEIIVLAVKAGNDIILIPPHPSDAVNAIYNAVIKEEISEERIDKSVRKILSAKRWLRMDKKSNLNTRSIIDSINNSGNNGLAEKIAKQSITLIKNDAGVIPLELSKYKKISCVTVTDGVGDKTATYFQHLLSRRLGYINSLLITNKSKQRGFNSAISSLKNSDLILMPVFMEVQEQKGKEKVRREQFSFIKKVLSLKAPVILISFKNPYLLSSFPITKTYLNTYSYTLASQQASLKALFGETSITGRLPVSIPDTKYHIGYGIKLESTISTKLTYMPVNKLFFSVDTLVINLVRDKEVFKADVIVGKNGNVIYQNSFGKIASKTDSLNKKGVFNLGSLTGSVALTCAVMLLIDEGKLSIDDRVFFHLNNFVANGKDNIKIRNLLLHNSGIGLELDSMDIKWTKENLLIALTNIKLKYKTGEQILHSKLNSLILQFIVEHITGKPLNDFLNERLFKPLGMDNTFFLAAEKLNLNNDIMNNNRFKYGSYLSQSELLKKIMNGITGYDGLYSSSDDLSKFAQMILQNGYYDGKQYLSAATIKLFTSPQLPESYSGFGWSTNISEVNICKDFSHVSFGYISDNGSSIWIDPDKKLFIILLTGSIFENTTLLQCEVIKAINIK